MGTPGARRWYPAPFQLILVQIVPGQPPAPDQALEGVLATLQPASRRSRSSSGEKPSATPRSTSSSLPSTATWQTTSPSSSASARNAAPLIPGTPAEHTALVLTALGPAFLQLAFGPGIDAPTFTQGLRALMRS